MGRLIVELVSQICFVFGMLMLIPSSCVNDHMTPGGVHTSVHVSVPCCGSGPPTSDVSLC